MTHANVVAARNLLEALGLPRGQLNDRSALTLLALADVGPNVTLINARDPMLGVTQIMDWMRNCYKVDYAPNTRETIRRQTLHQFRDAGLTLYNPDDPRRPVNSPKAVYQLAPPTLTLLRAYGTPRFSRALAEHVAALPSLAQRYASERQITRIPVITPDGLTLSLSPGAHSELIGKVIVDFAAAFVPGCRLLYAGDTGDKFASYARDQMSELGASIDEHGQMPDVVLHDSRRGWLVLVEAVTSHGPVDGKRWGELTRLFNGVDAGLVFVTAFPDRATMTRFLPQIAWETEVWVADAPTHLIHFNGDRFLGPHD